MKRSQYIFLILLASVFQYGFSQPSYNLIKNLGLPTNHFRDMIVDNDTIIGYGLAYNDSTLSQQGLLLAKFDSAGNFIKSNLILDSLGDHLSISKYWGKITKTSDGGYAMTAATVFRNSAILIKVKQNLEVEFVKEYEDTVNLSNYNYRILEIQDGYLLFGSIQRPNFSGDGFIRRVDKQGNTVWFKYFGDYNVWDNIIDVKQVNDSTFLACSVDNMTSNVYGSAQSKLRYIDWHGNVLDSLATEPDPEIGYLRKVIVMENGDIITYGVYLVEIIGDTKILQSTLAGFDANFQLKWLRHFGPIRSINADNELRDIEEHSDGNYISAGEATVKINDEPSRRVGWMYKFSETGDSLWSKFVDAPFPLVNNNSGFFGGVGILSSGNIIAGGSANEGNVKYIWLVKVTPDGCLDTLFCQPLNTLYEVPTKADIDVYPNPADEMLTIESSIGLEEGHVLLIDLQGKTVLSHPLQNSTSQLSLSTAHLAAGIYFLKIHIPAGVLHYGKILVVH